MNYDTLWCIWLPSYSQRAFRSCCAIRSTVLIHPYHFLLRSQVATLLALHAFVSYCHTNRISNFRFLPYRRKILFFCLFLSFSLIKIHSVANSLLAASCVVKQKNFEHFFKTNMLVRWQHSYLSTKSTYKSFLLIISLN